MISRHYFRIIIFLCIISAVVLLYKGKPSQAQLVPEAVQVTVNDLQKAGFTNIKKEVQQGARFQGPTLYFEVDDHVSQPSEAPNIVMVDSSSYASPLPDTALFSYGPDSHSFNVVGGAGKEATREDGRIAINFIKDNTYTVIIGPNKQKIETLALQIADMMK